MKHNILHTHHLPWWSWGTLRPLEKESQVCDSIKNRNIVNTSYRKKTRKPVLQSLLLVLQAQDCPVYRTQIN